MVGMKNVGTVDSYLTSSLIPTMRLAAAEPHGTSAAQTHASAAIPFPTVPLALDRQSNRIEHGIGDPGHDQIVSDRPAGSPVSASASAIAAARARPSSRSRVFSAIATTLARRAISVIRSWSSTSRRAAGSGTARRRRRIPGPPCGTGRGVRGAAVQQPERDAGVGRMQERALPLDPEQLAAALDAFEHELLGRAGEEVGDDGVDRDPPPRDRDPGLAGRDELALDPAARGLRGRARARRSSSRSRSRSRRCRTTFAPWVRFSPVGVLRPARRLAEVAQLDTVQGCESRELGVVGDELVQAAFDVEAVLDAGLEQLAPGGREAAALGRDADERGRRPRAGARRRRWRRSGSLRGSCRGARSRAPRRPRRAGSAGRRARSSP